MDANIQNLSYSFTVSKGHLFFQLLIREALGTGQFFRQVSQSELVLLGINKFEIK